jgi:hypothetical protein
VGIKVHIKLKEAEYSEDPDMYRRTILKWSSVTYGVKEWTGLN